MDETDRFISDGNIARFVDQLRVEADPVRQATLKRLLIEEENRFGATEERLAMVERRLTDGAAQIARLTDVVAELKRQGRDSASAERSLELSVTIQRAFEEFRAAIHRNLERQPPTL